jgi:hypothetical protein
MPADAFLPKKRKPVFANAFGYWKFDQRSGNAM